MIDTKELRRLAQEATPGGWYVDHGNYIYGCKDVTDGEEEWHPVIACTDDGEPVNFEGNADFIAAANPAAVLELLDRLEAAEKERDTLRAELLDANETVRELFHGAGVANMTITSLLTKIEAMEQQKPVAWRTSNGEGGYGSRSYADNENYQLGWSARDPNHVGVVELLYLAPGAKGE